MHLKDHISRDLVFIITGQSEKEAFLKELVNRVKDRFQNIDDATLLKRLIEREEQVSTGIGHSVAVPHATLDDLDESVCVVAQTPQGIDFKSLDSSMVHITFLLLSPPESTGVHLRLLARVARLASSQSFIRKMATAKNVEELYDLIEEEDGRHV